MKAFLTLYIVIPIKTSCLLPHVDSNLQMQAAEVTTPCEALSWCRHQCRLVASIIYYSFVNLSGTFFLIRGSIKVWDQTDQYNGRGTWLMRRGGNFELAGIECVVWENGLFNVNPFSTRTPICCPSMARVLYKDAYLAFCSSNAWCRYYYYTVSVLLSPSV